VFLLAHIYFLGKDSLAPLNVYLKELENSTAMLKAFLAKNLKFDA